MAESVFVVWIPVDEELPEPFIDVLIVIGEDGTHQREVSCGYLGKTGYWLSSDSENRLDCTVTHWAHMPDLPEY